MTLAEDDPGHDHDPPTDSSTTASPIRIGVAIMIVLLAWVFLIVPGLWAPLTLLHFVAMQGGPILMLVLLSVWWLLSRRLSRRERVTGLVLTIGWIAITALTVHSSARIVILIRVLPIALTVLVGLWAFFSSLPWAIRRWIGWVSFAAVLFATQFIRVESIAGNFAIEMVPRWKQTAEDRFLSSLSPEHLPSAQTKGDEAADPAIETPKLPREVSPGDSAQYRGARRDAVVRNVTFSTDWNADPPKEKWRHPVGPAWSSFCVVDPWFFTQEQRGDNQVVTAYELESGSPVWTHSREGRFEASLGGIGPRATPTYDRGDLFVTHATGIVERIDAQTGESVWEYDLIKKLDVRLPAWGFSSSPLVVNFTNDGPDRSDSDGSDSDGDGSNNERQAEPDAAERGVGEPDAAEPDAAERGVVIVFAGGGEGQGVIALDRETGTLNWSAGSGSHGYSSPQRAEIDGVDQVLMSENVGMVSLSAETGEEIWRHDWDIGELPRVTQPLVVDHTVFMPTGYGNGTMRIDVARTDAGWSTEEKWIANLKPYYNDMVYHNGFLFGFDGQIFMCVDAETGEKAWKRGRYGFGQVLLVKDLDLLVITTEKGDVVLAEANPEKLVEVARIPAVDGITWNVPVIAHGLLLVRNANEMVAFELTEE